MDKMQLIERATQDTTWVAFLLLLCILLITVCKSIYHKQFNEFMILGFNNKYLKLYFDNQNLISNFSFLLATVRIISISLLILIVLDSFTDFSKYSFINYLLIFGFLSISLILKFIIEKGISIIFNIQDFYKIFQFNKLTYKTYTGLAIFVGTFILYYYNLSNLNSIYIISLIFVTINIISYIISLKSFQKEFSSKIFYFILYLCTLEIAPYYFTYYWLTNY